MPMIEDMERTGLWLFRWRTYIPLLAVLLVPVALQGLPHSPRNQWYDHPCELFCLGLALLGLVIRALVVGYAPRRTSGRNVSKQAAETLNTDGIYSLVRNPLYLGNFLSGLGAALLLRVWWLPVIYSLLFMVYYERIIFAEEMFLRKKFGQQFIDWASKTPAFLPRLAQWRTPPRRFNYRRVLRREHQTFFGTIVVFFLIVTVIQWHTGQPVLQDSLWNAIALAGLAIFLIIRVLRQFTTVLQDKEAEPAP